MMTTHPSASLDTDDFRAETFLGMCSPPEREALLSAGTRRMFTRGEALFREGDATQHVVVILQGEIKLTKSTVDGTQVLIELRGAGDLTGELSTIDRLPRSATATALTATTSLTVQHETFTDLMRTHPGLAATVQRLLVARLRLASRRQLESGTVDALGRVCARLVELCDRSGVQVGSTCWEIDSVLSQQEIAEWIGISRDAVVRSLAAARRLGWIETGRRRFIITDLDDLRLRAA